MLLEFNHCCCCCSRKSSASSVASVSSVGSDSEVVSMFVIPKNYIFRDKIQIKVTCKKSIDRQSNVDKSLVDEC